MRHLPECDRISARQMYEDVLAQDWLTAGFRAHLERQRDRSAGIYLLRCADGCPVLEAACAHGRELAEEHGW